MGAWRAAEALAGAWISDDGDVQRGGFGLLPGSMVDVEYRSAKEQKFLKALGAEVGYVGWGIPPAAALVVHHGRQVGAMGKGDVAVIVGAQGSWPARVDGSSAGCQVLGDFLVRGNPRSNKDIVFEGYKTGLGLLPGVILEAPSVTARTDAPNPSMDQHAVDHHPFASRLASLLRCLLARRAWAAGRDRVVITR